MPTASDTRPSVLQLRWVQALLVLAVAGAVFLPGLGVGGLTMSEGHRVTPAWEMLETGEWFVTHMFGQPYLRKPPGTPWAIAVSSWVFGETEFAARLPSAIASVLMTLVAWGYATRWFGSPWGLAAGMAQALSPQFWESGRAAEIEATHNLGVQLAALAVIDLLVRGRAAHRLSTPALVLGVAFAGLTKGPAGALVLAGALLAPVVLRRSLRPWLGAQPWLAIGTSVLCVTLVYGTIAGRVRSFGLDPVTQSPGAFLWSDPLVTLSMPIVAFVLALPVALAALFPWGPDARAEPRGEADRERLGLARALVLAWACAVLLYALTGVGNPRYAMPAAVLLAPVVAWGVRLLANDGLRPTRRRLARIMTLGHPVALAGVLLVGAWVFVLTHESAVRASSGRALGVAMGEAVLAEVRGAGGGRVSEPVMIVADDAIEARPEVLLALVRTLRSAGVEASGRWVPGEPAPEPPPGGLALWRTDAGSVEAGQFQTLIEGDPARVLVEGGVHKFNLALLLGPPPTGPATEVPVHSTKMRADPP